jgi:uncharacterized RmlC-like cupin family protein
MQIIKIPLTPSLQKSSGRWLLYREDIALPKEFKPINKKEHFVAIPAKEFAANHKHERQEVLLGLHPDLVIIWQDKKGKKHEEKMNPDGKLFLFFIPPWVPHVVINTSEVSPAMLYEWTDSASVEAEQCDLLSD